MNESGVPQGFRFVLTANTKLATYAGDLLIF